MSTPAVVDSSVWIEYLREGNKFSVVKKVIHNSRPIYIPTVVIFEVYRKLAKSLNESSALEFVALLKGCEVVDLTSNIALTAGDLSNEHQIGTADSIVLAHACEIGVKLVTLDNDFRGIEGVVLL